MEQQRDRAVRRPGLAVGEPSGDGHGCMGGAVIDSHILDPVPERADLERRTTELLQRLIRFNTVNPPGNEQAVQEFLRDLLTDAGFECELLGAVEGRPNLVARMAAASDGPTLCLLGHVDTVLAEPSEWSVDPWSGELRDGCVWGRGALDMKSQVAAEAAAALALIEEGWRPEAGELLLVFTCDEETGAVRRRSVAVPRASRKRARRPRRQRGRRPGDLVRRPPRLRGLRGREGGVSLHALDRGRRRATPRCRASVTTRSRGWGRC